MRVLKICGNFLAWEACTLLIGWQANRILWQPMGWQEWCHNYLWDLWKTISMLVIKIEKKPHVNLEVFFTFVGRTTGQRDTRVVDVEVLFKSWLYLTLSFLVQLWSLPLMIGRAYTSYCHDSVKSASHQLCHAMCITEGIICCQVPTSRQWFRIGYGWIIELATLLKPVRSEA